MQIERDRTMSASTTGKRINLDGLVFRKASLADFAYQPIISTSSLRVHGFEALARLPDRIGAVCDLLREK